MTREEMYWQFRKKEGGIIYKKCTGCGEYFPETTEYFYKRNKSKPNRGFSSMCKKCSIKDSKRYYDPKRHTELTNFYYHNDPEYKKRKKSYNYTEKEKDRQAQWRKDNKDKVNEYSIYKRLHKLHSITKEEWENCKAYFNYECAYCGTHIDEHYNLYKGLPRKEDFAKEHVDDNGSNELNNCVPSCKNCNSSKHTSALEEWYNEKYPYYTKERHDKIIKWITDDYKEYIDPNKKPKRKYNRKQKVS